MQGFYDAGLYDIDTYDESVSTQRTATDFKETMARVVTELDLLAANSTTASPEFLVAALESVIADGTLSQVTIQETSGGRAKPWPMVEGGFPVMDVVVSARSLLKDVRHNLDTSANRWDRVRRSMHPAWFWFYNDSHTT